MFYLYFNQTFDHLLEETGNCGGNVAPLRGQHLAPRLRAQSLEPNQLGLKPSFIPCSCVTSGKWTLLCLSIPICKILSHTGRLWGLMRKHTEGLPGGYHAPVCHQDFHCFIQHFYYLSNDDNRDKWVGNRMAGRLEWHYLFSEASVEVNKDGACVSHFVGTLWVLFKYWWMDQMNTFSCVCFAFVVLQNLIYLWF